jgi:hypothetical protein
MHVKGWEVLGREWGSDMCPGKEGRKNTKEGYQERMLSKEGNMARKEAYQGRKDGREGGRKDGMKDIKEGRMCARGYILVMLW